MQMDDHKTLYPFYTIKKMPFIKATFTKIAIRWQQCLFFTHASFHTISNYVAYCYQHSALLHYMPIMSALNSHR